MLLDLSLTAAAGKFSRSDFYSVYLIVLFASHVCSLALYLFLMYSGGGGGGAAEAAAEEEKEEEVEEEEMDMGGGMDMFGDGGDEGDY